MKNHHDSSWLIFVNCLHGASISVKKISLYVCSLATKQIDSACLFICLIKISAKFSNILVCATISTAFFITSIFDFL